MQYWLIVSCLIGFSLLIFIVFGMNARREVFYPSNLTNCHYLEQQIKEDGSPCGTVNYQYGVPFKFAEVPADSYHETAPPVSEIYTNTSFIADALTWSLVLPIMFTAFIIIRTKLTKH